MNNDLISREALKKKLTPIKLYGGVYCKAITEKDIDNAPTVEPPNQLVLRARDDVELEQLKEAWSKGTINFTPIVAYTERSIIKCQDCKHQKKYWHEDRRMKEKGYWIYGCDLIDDSFVGTPVWGADDQFCSSAERK